MYIVTNSFAISGANSALLTAVNSFTERTDSKDCNFCDIWFIPNYIIQNKLFGWVEKVGNK